MKKVVSVVLVLVLVLALGAVAHADFGIVVTKHPTDETRAVGETAWFVSGAQYYTSMDWSFVDPSGRTYTVNEFRNMFPTVTVEGEFTTTLTVKNLSMELNGWAVFCNFHSSGDNASTNWGFFHVNPSVVPTYTAPTYTTPTYTTPTYDYYTYGDTTYYWDGTSLTDFGDGSMMYTGTDGSVNFVGDDGSYFNVYSDGSWDSYDAASDSFSGGMVY